jgi:hypothetical protein
VNKVGVGLFEEDMKIVMRNTAEPLAAVEGGQLGEVMCFELELVIGRGSDVVRLERRHVLQAAEAGTRVSEIEPEANQPYLVENLNVCLRCSVMRICLQSPFHLAKGKLQLREDLFFRCERLMNVSILIRRDESTHIPDHPRQQFEVESDHLAQKARYNLDQLSSRSRASPPF